MTTPRTYLDEALARVRSGAFVSIGVGINRQPVWYVWDHQLFAGAFYDHNQARNLYLAIARRALAVGQQSA